MSLHSTLLATWLLGLGLLIVPRAASGQVPASDSTAPAASDSQPAPTDSVPKADTAQATSDTVLQRPQPDSASRADSTRAVSDTAGPQGARGAAPADTATATATTAPPDSILTTACGGPEGPTTVARDLLVVIFASQAGDAERAAAAKSVDGELVGAVTGEPGAFYLRVPSGGEEYRLRVASDQLIQLDMVRQVGSRACPPLPPPEQARQKSP
jgi:hypothetical protein